MCAWRGGRVKGKGQLHGLARPAPVRVRLHTPLLPAGRPLRRPQGSGGGTSVRVEQRHHAYLTTDLTHWTNSSRPPNNRPPPPLFQGSTSKNYPGSHAPHRTTRRLRIAPARGRGAVSAHAPSLSAPPMSSPPQDLNAVAEAGWHAHASLR